jgi:hypothetical protein
LVERERERERKKREKENNKEMKNNEYAIPTPLKISQSRKSVI